MMEEKMIHLMALSGPHAGEACELAEDVNPYEFLSPFVLGDWEWTICYCSATPQEAYQWSHIEVVARIARALLHGRPVYFRGTVYAGSGDGMIVACIDRVFDADHPTYVASDDENGVLVDERPFEDLHRWN